jgi:hypothetical protein
MFHINTFMNDDDTCKVRVKSVFALFEMKRMLKVGKCLKLNKSIIGKIFKNNTLLQFSLNK